MHSGSGNFRAGDTAVSAKSGSGLGLSISRQFVHLHRGRMWLESEPGKGTTFFVELPITEGAGPAERATRWIKHDWVWVEKSFRTEKLGVAENAARHASWSAMNRAGSTASCATTRIVLSSSSQAIRMTHSAICRLPSPMPR